MRRTIELSKAQKIECNGQTCSQTGGPRALLATIKQTTPAQASHEQAKSDGGHMPHAIRLDNTVTQYFLLLPYLTHQNGLILTLRLSPSHLPHPLPLIYTRTPSGTFGPCALAPSSILLYEQARHSMKHYYALDTSITCSDLQPQTKVLHIVSAQIIYNCTLSIRVWSLVLQLQCRAFLAIIDLSR